jgi:predicted deacetylase
MTAATEFLPILAAAQAPAGSLIVSVHDVAPPTRTATEKILHELKAAGVRVTSLLVVPDYHRSGRSMADADFVSWLRDLEIDGHEIVLHGYFHQRPRSNHENWPHKIVTRFYTQDEAEFFDLDYDEAFARINRGNEEFCAARLSPCGFIAPAWLLSAEAERAARDVGMQYTTKLGSVIDLLTGGRQISRALVYSTRAPWRRMASLLWNAVLARGVEPAELVRLSIHPGDIESPAIWQQVIELTRRFASKRKVSTYRDWVGEQRINRAVP